jgi:hypothetical protein
MVDKVLIDKSEKKDQVVKIDEEKEKQTQQRHQRQHQDQQRQEEKKQETGIDLQEALWEVYELQAIIVLQPDERKQVFRLLPNISARFSKTKNCIGLSFTQRTPGLNGTLTWTTTFHRRDGTIEEHNSNAPEV